jgi:hypothetical protein
MYMLRIYPYLPVSICEKLESYEMNEYLKKRRFGK